MVSVLFELVCVLVLRPNVKMQFTAPEASHAKHHVSLMHDAGDPKLLRNGAAATSMPHEAKIFAKIVLRNLEHHQPECSKGKTASTSK